jgi:hypothetical protein
MMKITMMTMIVVVGVVVVVVMLMLTMTMMKLTTALALFDSWTVLTCAGLGTIDRCHCSNGTAGICKI